MVKKLYHIQLRKAIRLIPRSVCTGAAADGRLCGDPNRAPKLRISRFRLRRKLIHRAAPQPFKNSSSRSIPFLMLSRLAA